MKFKFIEWISHLFLTLSNRLRFKTQKSVVGYWFFWCVESSFPQGAFKTLEDLLETKGSLQTVSYTHIRIFVNYVSEFNNLTMRNFTLRI